MNYVNAMTLVAALALPSLSVAETHSRSLTKANAEAAASVSSSSSKRTGRWVTLSSMLQINAPINKTIDGQPVEKGQAVAVAAMVVEPSPLNSGEILAFGNAAMANDVFQDETKVLLDATALKATSFFSKRTDKKRPRNFETHKRTGVYTAIPNKTMLNELPKATGGKEWACLTEALYFEARGESISGIFAVAEVIANRKASKKFPNTICGVITQGAHRRNACQFSYKCDGHKEVYHEAKARKLVAKIAQIVLEDRAPNLTAGATFYHANSVNPKWARAFHKTATIGKHFFYRG